MKSSQQSKSGISKASLILTGDLKGVKYIQDTIRDLPSNTFNFCCTIDGSNRQEADLTMRPKKALPKQNHQWIIEQQRLEAEREAARRAQLLALQPQTYWTANVILANTKFAQEQYLQGVPQNKSTTFDIKKYMLDKRMGVVEKYEEIRESLQAEVDREYQQSRYKKNEEKITFEQFQEMKQQINYDIAWQIFDEVNQEHDVDRYVDLNCLDIIDAKAICKQKIYDVALLARDQQRNSQVSQQHVGPFNAGGKNQNPRMSSGDKAYVLIIQCADDHMVQMQQDKNGNPTGPVTNGILDTVSEELKMDHYYVPANKLILVRVDSKTLDNSVLNDW